MEPETSSIFLDLLTDLRSRATLLNTGEPVEFEVVNLPRLWNQTPDHYLRVKLLPLNKRVTWNWMFKRELALNCFPLSSRSHPNRRRLNEANRKIAGESLNDR